MTVTRTLRLDEDLDQALEKLAREEGESVNVLANRALRKLVEWDFQAEKMGLVSLSRDTVGRFLEPYTEEQVKELGRWAARENMMPLMLYVFGGVSLESLLKTVDAMERYMGRFTSEYTVNEGKHHITLRHGMGRKWSAFYAAGAEEVLATELGMDVVSTLTDDACFIEFKPKDRNPPKVSASEQH